MSVATIIKNKYFKCSLVSVLFILWVIWVGNFWLLLGLGIIFDYHITKKVNWTFWKKRNQKNSTLVEWLDALIFAVIAVTFINVFFFQNYKIPTGSMEDTLLRGDHLFVSKLSYGPRIPQTPIHFPFAQHTLPIINTKSYVEWVKFPYKRLEGLGSVERNDIVVFNFPAGDTVVLQQQARSYMNILREIALKYKQKDKQKNDSVKDRKYYMNLARDYVWDQFDVVVRPVDRRDNYIKRCVAVPGDTLQIKNTQVYINGEKQSPIETIQYRHSIITNGTRLNPKSLEQIGINSEELRSSPYQPNIYNCFLTRGESQALQNFKNVKKVKRNVQPKNKNDFQIFPHDPDYKWNVDHFGPLWIPEKNATVTLTLQNLPLYERIIDVYEDNQLQVKDSTIYINNKPAQKYTFKMNYYFMMGDNRHSSADSRYWGFVPENHIVGQPVFIWLSINKYGEFLDKIRWDRMFKGARE